MNLKMCSRKNCSNIREVKSFYPFGHVCSQCISEFEQSQSDKKILKDFVDSFREFLESPKPEGQTEDLIDVHEFIDLFENEKNESTF